MNTEKAQQVASEILERNRHFILDNDSALSNMTSDFLKILLQEAFLRGYKAAMDDLKETFVNKKAVDTLPLGDNL